MKNYKQTSQYGECTVLHSHFFNRVGYFIDIGAADGIRYTNTLNLIENDWNGLLVEPCHHFLKTLKENHEHSKTVDIFAGAVSDYDGTTKFHVWREGDDSQISTIVQDQYEKIRDSDYWSEQGKFTDEYQVEVLRPLSLFEKYKVPKYIHFVDIDAEASEMNILGAWPWNTYDVELFCIEFSMGQDLLIEYMASRGYASYIKTGGNILFCKKEKLEQYKAGLKNNMKILFGVEL